jgi:amino acid adenylation domain-containing protein
MSKDNIEDIYPLSPLQEGLLFHTLYSPDSAVYFQQLKFSFESGLNVEAWQLAWRKVVERHAVLRTGFVWQNQPRALQVVRKKVQLPWRQEDWRGLSADEQRLRFEEFLKIDQKCGFDLAKAPLLRLTLIRMGDEAYEFVCSKHHLLVDGWSTAIIVKELAAFYGMAIAGHQLNLENPRPYRDYIAWLQQQDQRKAEVFWREALQGFTNPTTLAADSGLLSLADEPDNQQRQQIVISAATTAKLRSFAQQHELTLNTVIVAAWAMLLSRYGGSDDVVFGLTVAGRPAAMAGIESMVGAFINTLPMRVQLPPDDQLICWLKKLQLRLLEFYEYDYSSLVQIQGWSDVPRGLPLFESMVVFENYPVSATEQDLSADLGLKDISSIERSSFPLGLIAGPGRELLLVLGYDRRRFDSDTIGCLLQHLQGVLENIAANTDQPLSGFSLWAQTEWHQMLEMWNDTDRDYGHGVCLHRLFEEQTDLTPNYVAVDFEAEQLTYQELNRRANQIAHYLRSLSIGPETLVGIYVERSLDLIIGLLGILKAGAAYVPIDPEYPEDRLNFILKDAQIPLLLTQERFVDRFSNHCVRILCLDRSGDLIAQHKQTNPASNVTADNPAYVIYTSGSTGQPKGVVIPHGAVCNTLLWRREAFSLTSEDRILQNISGAFDPSVWQIFGTLASGARLVLARPGGLQDTSYIISKIIEQKITITDFVPSILQVLLESPGLENCKSLRHVFCGGEVMTGELIKRFYARLDAALHNVYGPTETAIDATFWSIPRSANRRIASIGRPIANKQIWLLDSHLYPVSVNALGEIYISGCGLARGYLNSPSLTAERFIPNPFSDEPGARMYKTGDSARYLPDGRIEFVGRNDDQVKVRGLRIELSEIEAVLAAHPGVRHNVVMVREYPPGNKQLVAYLVSHNGALSLSEVRHFVKQRLPEYMVPSRFAFMDSLPLLSNGKVDRGALQSLKPEWTDAETGYVAPGNLVEEVMSGIWANIMQVNRIGVEDNFFQLGGQSLTAMRLISALREAFQVELSVRALFENPTISSLAAVIETQVKNTRYDSLSLLPRASRDIRQPMSFAQQRLWFLDRLTPDNALYNIAETFRLRGILHTEAFENSLNEIIRRHEVLRTIFGMQEERLIQIISAETKFEPRVIDLSLQPESEREAEARRLAREEAQHPFDLEQGPLIRATLLRLDSEYHWFLLTMHHIVSDGWSLGVFMGELSILYESFCSRAIPMLPELPVQYADYAIWQQNWLQGEELQAELEYWRQQLDGAPPIVELPTDRPRPKIRGNRGATVPFSIPKRLTDSLRALCQQESVTMFMTLLAAFKVLLYRYTSQEDIVIGTPIAGRNRKEVENLIGLFVNTLVMRTDLGGNPSFRELIERERMVALGAYAHQKVPFEKLVEEINPERDLSRSPLFQMMIVLQNAGREELKLSGLEVSGIESETGAAKFDLTLMLTEGGEAISGCLQYSLELYEEETIRRIARHYKKVLEEVVRDAEQRIGEIELMNDDERRLVLDEWNATEAYYPREKLIHELFEEQAARSPGAIALEHGDENLNYGELNARANQLAHRLRELGVGPDTLVGIAVERSPEMVIGLLGILKAGGAYVPIDPSYPSDRITWMLNDSATPVLLTQDRLVERLPEHRAFVVRLDQDWPAISSRSVENPETGVGPENLAYVIYTSGSTGKPKGVMIEHRSVVNLANWQADNFKITNRSRILQFFSYNFDGAVGETSMALLNGAALMMAPNKPTPGELIDFINTRAITVAVFVPSLLGQLDPDRLDKPETLTVVSVGETCPMDLALRWSARCNFINAYGPTEDTVYSHLWRVEREEINGNIPIGLPIHNTKSYILDNNLNPVPAGIIGDIYISGVGLARGYLNQPQATASKFIPNKFAERNSSSFLGVLTSTSAYDEIARFVADESLGQRVESSRRMAVAQRLSPEEILRLIEGLDEDLVEKTRRFISEYGDDRYAYNAFCRYFSEGFRDSYASCGLSEEVLRALLPFEEWQGRTGVDFCFGNAEVMQTLRKMGVQVIGIDLEPFFVQKARDKGFAARMGKVDLPCERFCQEFGIEEESQDFAISTLALDRLESPRNLIRNMMMVLKEGGRFALQTLLPIIGIDDGEIEPRIEYTPEQNRIVAGETAEQHKTALASLLFELGAGEINICHFPYAVASGDGIQEYTAWSFFGRKRIGDSEASQNSDYSRLYRTGDIGRYRADGSIEFLGRIDHQVKLRGFRIELGEIEAVLRQHPRVREAVVMARQDGPGEKRLVAYLVSDQQPAPTTGEVRAFLKQRLPDYMMPSAFLLLDQLSLTPNGKLDRHALPTLDSARAEVEDSYIPPRDNFELALVRIWEEMLQVNPIGITDNFFELGGHSLSALRLTAAIQSYFGRSLPLTTLFEEGTIEHLAEVLRDQFTPPLQSPMVAIQPHGQRPPIFFVHVGSGQVLCYFDLARHLGRDQPFYGLQDPNLSGQGCPFDSIEDMAAHYIGALRAVQPIGPYMLGGWSFGGLVAFEMAKQLSDKREQVSLLVLLDTGTPDLVRSFADSHDEAALLAVLAQEMYLPVLATDLRPFDLENQLQCVAQKMKEARIMIDDAHSFLRRQLDIFKGRLKATETYKPTPYNGQITLFTASILGPEAAAKRTFDEHQSELIRGWADLSTAPVDIYLVPGRHHEIAREPNVQMLARSLKECIDNVLDANGRNYTLS